MPKRDFIMGPFGPEPRPQPRSPLGESLLGERHSPYPDIARQHEHFEKLSRGLHFDDEYGGPDVYPPMDVNPASYLDGSPELRERRFNAIPTLPLPPTDMMLRVSNPGLTPADYDEGRLWNYLMEKASELPSSSRLRDPLPLERMPAPPPEGPSRAMLTRLRMEEEARGRPPEYGVLTDEEIRRDFPARPQPDGPPIPPRPRRQMPTSLESPRTDINYGGSLEDILRQYGQ